MKRQRIVYQNWIVDLGRDPMRNPLIFPPASVSTDSGKIAAVHDALHKLTPDEAEFLRLFYLQGLSYGDITTLTGRKLHRLESLHGRAVRKLAGLLRGLLPAEILDEYTYPRCSLCNHPEAEKINELIAGKSPKETWRRIYRELRTRFGVKVTTPQLLIGHQKYHMQEG